jgi:hypothetical protein
MAALRQKATARLIAACSMDIVIADYSRWDTDRWPNSAVLADRSTIRAIPRAARRAMGGILCRS